MQRCFVWPALTRRFAPASPRAELFYLTERELSGPPVCAVCGGFAGFPDGAATPPLEEGTTPQNWFPLC